jgi:hypothetical protein
MGLRKEEMEVMAELHPEIKGVEEEDWEQEALCTSMVYIHLTPLTSR